MRRRAVIVVLFLVAALVLPQAPAKAVAVGVEGMSHLHPEDANYSWVAVRVLASKRARVEVHLAGPRVVSENPVSCRAPGNSAPENKQGKVLAVFKIKEAGKYTAHATATKAGKSDTAQASHDVPAPPDPKWGPFRFPADAGCHKGWPTS